MPSAAVERFLDHLESAGVELHSLMLLRHGEVVAEGWWEPYTPEGVQLLYSLSKSFTSTAVGLAVAEGRLSVDDPVASFFPQVDQASLHPRVLRMRVRHLLSMSSGHRDDTLASVRDANDPASAFLALVPEEEPGVWFTYNNGATLMLSLIVTRVTGERLLEYLRPRLLAPLGIGDAYWTGTAGFDHGFSGLHLTTEAIARFGQLYLQGGEWQGQQLVPADWVAEATCSHVDNPREPNPDWRQGYGYQFWRCQHDGYRGDGAYGQFCVILPEHDVVLATTAATEDMQAILDAVWTLLLPAFSDEISKPQPAAAALADRLAALTVPPVRGEATPGGVVASGPWRAEMPGEDQPVRSLAVTEAVGGSGWVLQVTEADRTYEVACGHGEWRSQEHNLGGSLTTAACGGWTGAATFTAEIVFTQTPHRLVLVADVDTGMLAARWHTAPLSPIRPRPPR
ncbi:MAG: Beta-lactamase class C-like and penicillin binding proteins (PBPs) superfamily [uncultured Propionibacteriaceae bacterium]|uniref:Beta-lactamase class C-like and penicillin binding proteins (PBPs) superfamily n=1 Tax=uncultured Propionibacteriaceae bacterium TaxID=257457 RepID=A0A6J4NGT0_9ACTN|nr:MAG: Beta-lactamase class C-like and penicillin binding proteins (PBPs) superfamily [uncultured Propionibacteriaceae bacterium]